MSLIEIMVIVIILGIIIGGILLLKKSAKKFDLTDEQLKKIKERNSELDNEEKKEE